VIAPAPSGGAVAAGHYALAAMKIVRRVLAALMMAGIAAAGIRVKGRGGTPPQHGGWRPLELPDRRAS
jgi:alpha-beta hydrolase superfamily lysophospholipase